MKASQKSLALDLRPVVTGAMLLLAAAVAFVWSFEARAQNGPMQTGADQTRFVQLIVGQQTFLSPSPDRRAPVVRAAISDEKVGHVAAINDKEVRVVGLAPGRTGLAVWVKLPSGHEMRTDYNVVVRADLAGLRQKLWQEPALRSLRVEEDGSRILLTGDVRRQADFDKADRLAKAFAGERIVNLANVVGQQTVAVDVKVAAVSVSSMKALGFDFRLLGRGFQLALSGPSAISEFTIGQAIGGGTAINVTSGLPVSDAFNLIVGGSDSNLAGVLSALTATDMAEVLAQPTLVVKSGEKAQFLAGGEVPIPVPQGGSGAGAVSIEYKPFGVALQIAPKIIGPDRISLQIAPEVSELDFGNSLTLQGFTVPAIRKRSTSTLVELNHGQSFILAGLMLNQSGNVEEKVPWLGDIPIIGPFFRRVTTQKEQQELIIIATPRLVDPMPKGHRPNLPGSIDDPVPYSPSMNDILLGRKALDDYVIEHGLIR